VSTRNLTLFLSKGKHRCIPLPLGFFSLYNCHYCIVDCAFTLVVETEDIPPYIHDVYRDSAWDTNRCSSRDRVEDMYYGEVGSDCLLDHIMNCSHLWCLHDSQVSCCQVLTLQCLKLARVTVTPSDMSDSCLLQSFSSNSTFIMLYCTMRWCRLLGSRRDD
jgi:hypothetical protein